MIGDARGEAEEIVTDFASAVVDSDFVPEVRRSIQADVGAPYDRLVAALAVVIELQDAKDARDSAQFMWADVRLSAALSALRARAGEET